MSTTGGDGGLGLGANETIGTIGNGEVKIYKVCVIPDWQIERIADAVAKKLSCDECEIAKYHNLEDDDSPCLNCGEE